MESVLTRILTVFVVGAFICFPVITAKANPWIIVTLSLITTAILLCVTRHSLLQYANHRAGLLAEQVVGRMLDQLSSDQIQVFHDLEIREPGGKPWNIDHVVVMRSGIFSMETKSRRKPNTGSSGRQKGHELVYDGSSLIFPEPMKAESFSLEQARGNATWLSKKLSSLNGELIPVSPALVFPGWLVKATGKGDVSVMNHNQLKGFFSRRAGIFTEQRFRAITAQLSERSRIDLSAPA